MLSITRDTHLIMSKAKRRYLRRKCRKIFTKIKWRANLVTTLVLANNQYLAAYNKIKYLILHYKYDCIISVFQRDDHQLYLDIDGFTIRFPSKIDALTKFLQEVKPLLAKANFLIQIDPNLYRKNSPEHFSIKVYKHTK